MSNYKLKSTNTSVNKYQLRYIVDETSLSSQFDGGFEVQDTKHGYRKVCVCALLKDAGMIAGLLNKEKG